MKIINYSQNIKSSGLSIYDPLSSNNVTLWIPSSDLEEILNRRLARLYLGGVALRTRAKLIKINICKVLGYPVPTTFRKTQPRFPGQYFDVYVQKSNNLQIWNEEISPRRRYVIIKLSSKDVVESVRVISGTKLAKLDTTGTLTQKYQAQLLVGKYQAELVSAIDTRTVLEILKLQTKKVLTNPTYDPSANSLVPIKKLFFLLRRLIGTSFEDSGIDQERNRGEILHRLVATALGYKTYGDTGQFPDIRNQILEIKLQMSPTIDLGLVSPDSIELLDVPKIEKQKIMHKDIRYALFYAKKIGTRINIKNLLLVTGQDFFSRFRKFGGKIINKKIQIPLSATFFIR